MKQIINLGNKDYEFNINFKLSYNFLKYRNKITTGFDITKATKKVVEEIMEMQQKVQDYEEKLKSEGKDIDDMTGLEFIKDLSPEAKEFLQSQNNSSIVDKFTAEEVEDIVSKFTGITNKDEIDSILDIEVENNGYDNMIQKLMIAVQQVFMNAKSSSIQKEMSKKGLVEVATK